MVNIEVVEEDQIEEVIHQEYAVEAGVISQCEEEAEVTSKVEEIEVEDSVNTEAEVTSKVEEIEVMDLVNTEAEVTSKVEEIEVVDLVNPEEVGANTEAVTMIIKWKIKTQREITN